MKERLTEEKKFICDIDGFIYKVKFNKKNDFNYDKYASFIELVKKSNLDLLFIKLGFGTVDEIIEYFNNLDIYNLNLIYCKGIEKNIFEICDFILSYFELFVNCRKELFCSKREVDIYIKYSSLPMFFGQESKVIDIIRSSIKLDVVKDIGNSNMRERRVKLKRKKA